MTNSLERIENGNIYIYDSAAGAYIFSETELNREAQIFEAKAEKQKEFEKECEAFDDYVAANELRERLCDKAREFYEITEDNLKENFDLDACIEQIKDYCEEKSIEIEDIDTALVYDEFKKYIID